MSEKQPTCQELIRSKTHWMHRHLAPAHGVRAKFFENGLWYCATHAPSKIKEREAARDAAEHKRDQERRTRQHDKATYIISAILAAAEQGRSPKDIAKECVEKGWIRTGGGNASGVPDGSAA